MRSQPQTLFGWRCMTPFPVPPSDGSKGSPRPSLFCGCCPLVTLFETAFAYGQQGALISPLCAKLLHALSRCTQSPEIAQNGCFYCTQTPEFAVVTALKNRNKPIATKRDKVTLAFKVRTNFSRNFVRL